MDYVNYSCFSHLSCLKLAALIIMYQLTVSQIGKTQFINCLRKLYQTIAGTNFSTVFPTKFRATCIYCNKLK